MHKKNFFLLQNFMGLLYISYGTVHGSCRIQIFYIQKESLTMEGYFIISFCSHKNEQMK
jgi:hypothetical protein